MNDLINASFQVGGAVVTWWNVRATLRDRELKGIRAVAIGFFACWNGWNLFFYQPIWGVWSYVGGVGLMAANLTWFTLAIYFSRKEQS